MKHYTLGEVLKNRMLKKFDGTPYASEYARKFLVSANGTPNPLYFPDAKKIEGRYGLQWQFSDDDIKKFNSRK